MNQRIAAIALVSAFIVAAAAFTGAVIASLSGGDDDRPASTARRTEPAPSPAVTTTGRAASAPGEQDVRDPAADAARAQYQLMSDGEWAKHWDALHSDQRKYVPVELYTQCRARIDLEFEQIRALRVRSDPVVIDGVRRDAREVTLQVIGYLGGERGTETVTRAIHQVEVQGRWYWVLTEEALAAFRRGECPG